MCVFGGLLLTNENVNRMKNVGEENLIEKFFNKEFAVYFLFQS